MIRPRAALAAAEALVPALVTETRATMFLVGLDGVVGAVMGRGLETLGIDTRQLIGRDVREVLPESTVLRDHIAQAAGGASGEFLLHLAEGDLELRYAPLLDGDGSVRAIAATAWDVTARRSAEVELRELTEEMRVILANAPVVIFAFDCRGIVTLSEGRALDEVGLARDVHVGESVFDIWPDTALAEMAHRALGGEACESVSEVRSLGRAFQTTYQPIRDQDGEVSGVVAVAVDISERLQADRARADAEARMRFLAGVSHELRTPLNSILGFAQLLGQGVAGDLTARQARYVENILTSGHHLLSLVNDLLDIERLAAGRRELQPVHLALDAAVRDVLDDVAPLADGRGLQVDVDLGPAIAVADDRAARQILLNLLSNAIKFSPEGGRLRIEVASGAGTAEVAVTDQGPGIAPELQESIFDEFAAMSIESGAPSTGLGLCLSRRLARAMGGDVRVQSAGAGGSTFTVALPAG